MSSKAPRNTSSNQIYNPMTSEEPLMAEPRPAENAGCRNLDLILGGELPDGTSSYLLWRARTHAQENPRRNTSARRDTKNSRVSGAAFTRPAASARRPRFHRSHGF